MGSTKAPFCRFLFCFYLLICVSVFHHHLPPSSLAVFTATRCFSSPSFTTHYLSPPHVLPLLVAISPSTEALLRLSLAMAVASAGSLPPQSLESSHLLHRSQLRDTPFASHEVRSPPSEPRDLSDRVLTPSPLCATFPVGYKGLSPLPLQLLRSGRLSFRSSQPARFRSNIAVRPPSCLTRHCNRHSISSTSTSFHLSGETPSTLHLHGSPPASVICVRSELEVAAYGDNPPPTTRRRSTGIVFNFPTSQAAEVPWVIDLLSTHGTELEVAAYGDNSPPTARPRSTGIVFNFPTSQAAEFLWVIDLLSTHGTELEVAAHGGDNPPPTARRSSTGFVFNFQTPQAAESPWVNDLLSTHDKELEVAAYGNNPPPTVRRSSTGFVLNYQTSRAAESPNSLLSLVEKVIKRSARAIIVHLSLTTEEPDLFKGISVIFYGSNLLSIFNMLCTLLFASSSDYLASSFRLLGFVTGF